MNNDIFIELYEGKYQYRFVGGKQLITRYDEPWRDETGDGLLLAMAQRIEELEDDLKDAIEYIEQPAHMRN